MKHGKVMACAVLLFFGLLPALAGLAAAEFPERAIEVLVPFGAGGGSDTAARAVVEGMKTQLKHGVVVNNMPGGGATKGMLYVSQQPADGYTVLAVTTSHLIDAVKPKTRAHIMNDFDPLCRIQWDTSGVIVAGDSKFKTLAELIDFGKKNPKMLKFAGTSPGGWSEIQTVAFFKEAGVQVTFVPFDSGAEIKAAILGGHITGAVEELAETLSLINAGKLKALCVLMEKRHPALPDVPSSVELKVNYTHGLMRAWGVKKGTPPEQQKFLLEVIQKSLDNPVYVKYIQDNHLDVRPGFLGPMETRAYWEEEIAFFAGVLKELGYVK